METLHNLEIPIILAIQQLGTWLIVPMRLITELGNEQFFILLLPILIWCVDYSVGLQVGLMLLISGQANSFFKLAFHSPRPFWVASAVKAYVLEGSFGAPSGHAMNTLSVFGMAALGLKQRWVTILSAVLVLLVGISRLYLGMHFISDVIFGWIIAILLLLLTLKLKDPIIHWLLPKRLSYQILVILLSTILWIALGMSLFGTYQNTSLPVDWVTNAISATGIAPSPFSVEGIFTNAGLWTGVGIGAIWMQKNGGYSAHGSITQYIFRIVIGICGTLLIWRGLGTFFPRDPSWISFFLRLARYALVGMWLTAGAPWLFIRAGVAKGKA